ncbi:hypothetical protein [Mycoplasma sp. Ms02]|uniref:hypothetical protein n=1 Tax=Mycoplasma sp. Ms02 TaxID=353851 RepID=UPI001C89BE28|nr:hypothetical protein [Mycoplasma sp. Ms02]QZE12414.1 hypothetical protein K4L35_00260 [Mycoplasma sp. Ms02]
MKKNGFFGQLESLLQKLKAENSATLTDGENANSNEITDSKVTNMYIGAKVMQRDWAKNYSLLISKEYEWLVDALPYLSLDVKTAVKKAINDVDIQNPPDSEEKRIQNAQKKGLLYKSAEKLSGIGPISGKDASKYSNPKYSGSAKSLIKLIHEVEFKTQKPKNWSKPSSGELNIYNLFDLSPEELKTALKGTDNSSYETSLKELKTEVDDNFNKASNYSDYKIKLWKTGNLTEQDITEYANKINQISSKLLDSYTRLNGSTVSIDYQDKNSVLVSDVVKQFNSSNQQEKTQIESKIIKSFTNESEILSSKNNDGWIILNSTPSENSWSIEITSLNEVANENNSLEVGYKVYRPFKSEDKQTTLANFSEFKTKISGFKKPSIAQDLEVLKPSLSYSNSNQILVQKQRLEDEKYIFSFSSDNKTYTVSKELDSQGGFANWKINELNAKIQNIVTTDLESPDVRDITGETKVSFRIVSKEDPLVFKDYKVSVNGFKTELQRLYDLKTDSNLESSFDNETLVSLKQKTIDKVTTQELADYLNGIYQNSEAKVIHDDLQVQKDFQNNSITLKYRLNSTRNGMTTIKTEEDPDKLFVKVLNGFKSESQRLNELVANITVNYRYKSKMPSETVFTPEANNDNPDLIITINDEMAKYKDGSWVFETQQAKISNLKIENKNDEFGSVNVVIENLISTKPEFTSESTNQPQTSTLQDFKTEKKRLDEILNNTLINSSNIDNDTKETNYASDLTKDKLVNLLNPLFQNQQAEVIIENDLSSNKDQGTVNFAIKLKSKRDGLTNVKSDNKSIELEGFKKPEKTVEEQPVSFDNISVAVSWIAEQEQNSIVSSNETAQNPQSYSFIVDDTKLIEDVLVAGFNEINGNVLLEYTIKDKRTGQKSQKLYKSFSGFMTELQRMEMFHTGFANSLDLGISKAKTQVLPSEINVENISSSIINDATNKVLFANALSLKPNDLLGNANLTYTLQTAKINSELYKITAQNENAKAIFAEPSSYDVSSERTITLNNFDNQKDRVIKKINQENTEQEIINYLSNDEKQLLVSKLDNYESEYKKDPENKYQETLGKYQEIENEMNLSGEALNNLKKQAYLAINKTNYPYLNDDQIKYIKKQMIDSVLRKEDFSSDLKTKSVNEVNDYSKALNAQMKSLNKKTNKDVDSHSNYHEISEDLNKLSDKDAELINSYKTLIDLSNDLLKNNFSSTNNDVVLLLDFENNPGNSNWNLIQVNKLNDEVDKKVKEIYKNLVSSLSNLNTQEIENFKNLIDQLELGDNLFTQSREVYNKALEINQTKQEAIDQIKQLRYVSSKKSESYVKRIKEVAFVEGEKELENKEKLVSIVKQARKDDLAQGIDNLAKNIESIPFDQINDNLRTTSKLYLEELKNYKKEIANKYNSEPELLENHSKVLGSFDLFIELKDKYQKYLLSDVNSKQYLQVKQTLSEAIKDLSDYNKDLKSASNKEMSLKETSDVMTQLMDKYKAKSFAEIQLVDSLLNILKPSYTKEQFVEAFESAKTLLNSYQENNNDQIINYIKSDDSMYFEIAKKHINHQPISESDVVRADVIKNVNFYKSNVFKSALVSLLPSRKSSKYKDIEQMFRDVWAMDFLSTNDKYLVNLDILEFKNYKLSDRFKARARMFNELKANIYQRIAKMKNLNSNQKNMLLEELKNEDFISKDPSLQEQIMRENIEKAQSLGKAMEDLQRFLDDYKSIDEQENIHLKNAKRALEFDKSSSPILNINDISDLKVKIFEQEKENVLKRFKNLEDLKELQKQQLSHDINNANSLSELQKAYENAQTANNQNLTLKQSLDAYVLNDPNITKTEILKKINNDSDLLSKYKNLIDALDNKQELQESYDLLKSLDINSQNYSKVKQKVSQLVQRNSEYKGNTSLQNQIEELNKDATSTLMLLEVFENNEAEKLNELTKNTMDKQLSQIVEKVLNNKTITQKEINELNQPNVIKTALAKFYVPEVDKNKQNQKTGFSIWWWISIALATLGIAVIMPLIIKKFKK